MAKAEGKYFKFKSEKEINPDFLETFTFDSEKIILEQGDKITLIASPDIGGGLSNLSATVSYLEV